MNNGYQNFNGCGADKEGGKIFNTFFYPELQSKHVRPLATNVLPLAVSGGFGTQNCQTKIKVKWNTKT
jgi:hypothetical protein